MNAPAPRLIAGDIARAHFIGGSDAAALYGISPWKTPLQLWEEKTRPEREVEYVDPARSKFFRRRKRQEPVVAEMLAEEYGIEVTRLSLDGNPNRYRDSEHPFFAAEIDFEFCMSARVRDHFPARDDFLTIPDGTPLNGEIKTVHPYSAAEWGEHGSEDVPLHYAAQIMWGLGVTRRPAAICAALFGLDTLLAFPVMADAETIAAMRAKAYAFWCEHVMTKTPPPALSMPDMLKLYGRKLGRPVELTEDGYAALADIDIARRATHDAKEQQAAAELKVAKEIAAAWGVELLEREEKDARPDLDLKDNAALTFNGRLVGTWNAQRGTYLDQKRLAEERPDIVRALTREHFYRVFRLKKEKAKS